MNITWIFIISFLLSVVLSLLLTHYMIKLAHIMGWIVKPRIDRWHKKPTALMGGIAFFTSFLIIQFISSFFFDINYTILMAFLLMFLTGVLDDFLELKPIIKLLAQVFGTFLLIYEGYVFGGNQLGWLGIPITFLWVIGITNAINLLDNMDGLAAGIGTIISLVAGLLLYEGSDNSVVLISFSLAGSLLGFLKYNFNPAKIFMGDSGSLFIGFTLSFLSLSIQKQVGASSVILLLLTPLTLMAIPILDTSLVTFKRIISGRRIAQGGKDHSSHRLVALGLSERKAVFTLYLITLIWGCFSILMYRVVEITSVLLLILLWAIFSAFFGLFLGYAKVYNESEEKIAYLRSRGQMLKKNTFVFRFLLVNKKIIIGLVFDILIVTISFFLAKDVLKLDLGIEYWILGFFITTKVLIFFLTGLYKRIWRYTSVSDLTSFLTSNIIATIILIISFQLEQVQIKLPFYFFFLDLVISFMGVCFVRVSFKLIKETFSALKNAEELVMIYGAGDVGYYLSRELQNNAKYRSRIVGFIDDDKGKYKMLINGIEVKGGKNDIQRILKKVKINKIIISSDSIKKDSLQTILNILNTNQITITRFSFQKGFMDI
jgi:UDP-GlcNAc:undecaprenyl-phosphate/decaprenyl-phosphate GlcNAc-1-phosphate transferase